MIFVCWATLVSNRWSSRFFSKFRTLLAKSPKSWTLLLGRYGGFFEYDYYFSPSLWNKYQINTWYDFFLFTSKLFPGIKINSSKLRNCSWNEMCITWLAINFPLLIEFAVSPQLKVCREPFEAGRGSFEFEKRLGNWMWEVLGKGGTP